MAAAADIGRNHVSKHQVQPECGELAGWRKTRRPNPSRETKFSGANGDREISFFPVQLTTSRTDNLTRLIHTLPFFQHAHFIPIVGVVKERRTLIGP